MGEQFVIYSPIILFNIYHKIKIFLFDYLFIVVFGGFLSQSLKQRIRISCNLILKILVLV